MPWRIFALPGVDSSLCSAMISRAISAHRGSARPSPPAPTSLVGSSPARAASRSSRAAATQRLTVRTLTPRSAALRPVPPHQRHPGRVLRTRLSRPGQLLRPRPVTGQHLVHLRRPFPHLHQRFPGQLAQDHRRHLAQLARGRPRAVRDHPRPARGERLAKRQPEPAVPPGPPRPGTPPRCAARAGAGPRLSPAARHHCRPAQAPACAGP